MKKLLLMASLGALLSCKNNTESSSTTDSTKVVATDSSVAKPLTLAPLWETDTVSLITPEAVLFDSLRNVVYVSCIGGVPPEKHDGDGYIAKITTDGKITEAKWIKGLDAPKGLGLVGNKLYVTDIDKIVEIDVSTGKILKKYTIAGAIFMNDITTTANGDVFASDSYANKIIKLSNGKVEEWYKNDSLGNPNGLLALGETLFMVTFGKGEFFKFNLADKTLTKIAPGIAEGDGIVQIDGGFITSGWGGIINSVTEDGKITEILNTKINKVNSADIWYIKSSKTLLVPTFFKNKVVAYTLNNQ